MDSDFCRDGLLARQDQGQWPRPEGCCELLCQQGHSGRHLIDLFGMGNMDDQGVGCWTPLGVKDRLYCGAVEYIGSQGIDSLGWEGDQSSSPDNGCSLFQVSGVNV